MLLLKTYIIIVRGDIDSDGMVTLSDLLNIKCHMSSGEGCLKGNALLAADYNGDGYADLTDFLLMRKLLG